MNMQMEMPVGDFVKPQPRGQVTIPKKVRKKLNLNKDSVLNVFEEDGIIVMVPVKISPEKKDFEWEEAAEETSGLMMRDTDWTGNGFSTDKYMKAVRYNPLVRLREKRRREVW